MKILKSILYSIYPILILLLLLSNLKGCNQSNPKTVSERMDSTRTVETPERESPTPGDSTSIVKQAERTGQSGNLKVTLMWNFYGDIDLHVKQPNGREIYYDKAKDNSTGGYLDIDNRNGGNGSAENIFWENPPKGVYDVSLTYYQESQYNGKVENGLCSVVVFQAGKVPQTYQVEMATLKETKQVVSIEIK